MPEFKLMGLPMAALWPRTAQKNTRMLTDEQIATAKEEIKRMTDIVDELDQVLTEHSQAIQTIEVFMEQYAKRAAAGVDPMRLQAALDRIKDHTSRLAALMAKFALTP